MSITTNVRNRLVDAMNVAFDAIGKDASTKMPKPKTRDNRGPIAWDYFVSSHLLAMAKARFESVKKQAIAVGLIFDHEKNPREPGINEPIYIGEHVTIWLTVTNPSSRVDADTMSQYLLDKGVSEKLVQAAYAHATKKSRPPHSFKVALVAPDQPDTK